MALYFVPVLKLLQDTKTQPRLYPFLKTITVTGSAEMEIIPDEI